MDRKKEIIYATLELASEIGLRAVSMQMIAERIGIKKASVYNHFASRDEIVEAMYTFLREKSKAANGGAVDFESLFSGHSLKEILTVVVDSYKELCASPEMFAFYKIIMSERTMDKKAAEIMVMETEKMISSTTMLFYALQAKGYTDMKNIEVAAYSFAMGVNSIINYEFDLAGIDRPNPKYTLDMYIDEFCEKYGKKEGNK